MANFAKNPLRFLQFWLSRFQHWTFQNGRS